MLKDAAKLVSIHVEEPVEAIAVGIAKEHAIRIVALAVKIIVQELVLVAVETVVTGVAKAIVRVIVKMTV